ncbi:hypothetical protein ASD31_00345 [Rhizobium sp. Root482]|nr:hypothetical protein ASD31_00345 [Rhizobium sp. Root482]
MNGQCADRTRQVSRLLLPRTSRPPLPAWLFTSSNELLLETFLELHPDDLIERVQRIFAFDRLSIDFNCAFYSYRDTAEQVPQIATAVALL